MIPALLLLAAAGTAEAQKTAREAGAAEAQPIVAVPDAIEFGPGPASLPPGARLAVIEGDPSEAGEFTMRLWMPAGYEIPPHFHPVWEHVTVVQGSFVVGMGETFDRTEGTRLPVGSFGALPPGMRHFAWTDEETVIQLHGQGPWRLTYVDPADDPRN